MHTEIYTYFTNPDGRSKQLYSAEGWVRARLQLETAGPVSVSTREDVSPVLSGKGVLIPTVGELEFVLPKGDRIFIASESINRVKFLIEPIPWLEKISYQVNGIIESISGGLRVLGGGQRKSPVQKPSPKGPPCPPNLY